jgi:hypothetical protein
VGEDGFCKYWVMRDKPMRLEWMEVIFSGDVFKEVVGDDGLKCWVAKANMYTCRDCPVIIDEKMISLIKERLLQSEKKINL